MKSRFIQKIHWAVLPVATPLLLSNPASAASFGELAAQEVYYISENLAGRSVGSSKEQETIDYLFQRLTDFGYEPMLQPFTYPGRRGQLYSSYNIIAKQTGTTGKQVIVGAHYDSAPSGIGLAGTFLDRSNLEGTNDNASGMGVLLELAQRLKPETNLTHTFILFGAEEVGLVGSRYYADNMTQQEIKNTVGMINLDSLIFGDYMYFNAGRNAAIDPKLGGLRDMALDIASELGIEARTNPGLNEFYPAGTGCCSDLEAFDVVEPFIPVLGAEATNWSIGDLDGYQQTADPRVPFGATWHEPDTDNVEFINSIFPGLIEERTADYTQVLNLLLHDLDKQAVPEPTSVIGMAIALTLAGMVTRNKKAIHK